MFEIRTKNTSDFMWNTEICTITNFKIIKKGETEKISVLYIFFLKWNKLIQFSCDTLF